MNSMSAKMHVTLLGTGTSTGIPVIGCLCRVCTSTDSRDQRTRCACYIRAGGIGLVIDTGPDFRRQALQEDIGRIDAVLYTHHHYDHIAGMDDLRPFFFGNRCPMPCYASSRTAEVLQGMFPYIFNPDDSYRNVPPLVLHVVDSPFEVQSRYELCTSLEVTPLEVYHGEMSVLGYRIGRLAYMTDTSHIPESTFSLLDDLDVLVLDALRYESHPTHFTIEQAVAVAQRIAARQTYLIHITHSILHAEDDALLPEGIALGYDGLSFDVLPSSDF